MNTSASFCATRPPILGGRTTAPGGDGLATIAPETELLLTEHPGGLRGRPIIKIRPCPSLGSTCWEGREVAPQPGGCADPRSGGLTPSASGLHYSRAHTGRPARETEACARARAEPTTTPWSRTARTGVPRTAWGGLRTGRRTAGVWHQLCDLASRRTGSDPGSAPGPMPKPQDTGLLSH